jgi:hypothetical protein
MTKSRAFTAQGPPLIDGSDGVTIMITFEELNKQNHEIGELTKVLSYLLADREICDTSVCCDLFYRFCDKVSSHLDKVDHTYTSLLSNADKEVNKTATNFMGGSQEIRRIFTQHMRKWCDKRKHAMHISNHDDFYKQTSKLFDLVLNRIQDETEHLYPLIREIRGDSQRAA